MQTARNFDLREPSLGDYIAGLNAADRRWADESAAIAASDELTAGAFATTDTVIAGGMVTIPGSGDYEGWKLSGYDGKGPRDGFHLTAPPTDGDRHGSTVGFVILNRDGTWTACHDGFNHRPGVSVGCCGVKVKMPSAEAAYRDVVVRHARHTARYGQ